MRQTCDGFNYKTLQEDQYEQAQKPPKWVPENPIHIARRYLTEHEGEHGITYRGIARKFGVSQAEVCYHIALVKRLPEGFVTWLEQSKNPDELRVFTERRLRSIVKLKNQEEQSAAIGQLRGSIR